MTIAQGGTSTRELAGLAGTMEIIIEGKAHSYRLDYSLPASS